MFGWWSSSKSQGVVETGKKDSGKENDTETTSLETSDNGGFSDSSTSVKPGLQSGTDKKSELDFVDVAKNMGSR